MELSKQAIKKIKESTELRLKIALALGIGEASVQRAIQRKSSTLTKYAAIQVIKEETGFTDEQIVVNNKVFA